MSDIQEAFNEVLTGGNHLANYLIGKFGPTFAKDYPFYLLYDDPKLEQMDRDDFDVWSCWACIMRAKVMAHL